MQIIAQNDTTNASFLADEQTAINILDAALPNNITVTIKIGFGDYNGTTLQNQNVSEGGINFGYFLTYQQLRTDLLTFGQPGFFNGTNLPAGTSINGQSNFFVSSSVAKIFGIQTNGAVDGFVGIGTGFSAGAVRISAFLHEIGHALARVPNIITSGGTNYSRCSRRTSWVRSGPIGRLPVLAASTASDTSDMLLRNTAGTFEVYDISNNRITNAASLGAVGTAYTTIGFGNFSSLGETDMLMRTLPSGQIQVYDIKNNQITGSASLGAIGAVWLTAGISNHGSESDLVERNSSTGGFEIYDINSNRITNAAFMGTVGLEWSVLGFGNFSSRGTGDMIMRNIRTGGLEVYDIANNQITGAAFLGAVGLDWQYAGIGPIHAAGAFDLVLRNASSGAFEVYDIANNQLIGAAALGAVGLDWQVGGIAVDPPELGGSMGAMVGAAAHPVNSSFQLVLPTTSQLAVVDPTTPVFQPSTTSPTPAASGGSAGDVAPLVQAMAGFGGGSGATDNSTTAPLGAETSQQTLLTAPHHA